MSSKLLKIHEGEGEFHNFFLSVNSEVALLTSLWSSTSFSFSSMFFILIVERLRNMLITYKYISVALCLTLSFGWSPLRDPSLACISLLMKCLSVH